MVFKKQILTEAPNNNQVQFSPEVINLIEQGKWGEAYSLLSTPADIDAFLDLFLANYRDFQSFQDKIEVIKEPLKRELMSFGFKAFQKETNPILWFLTTYLVGNSFTEEQFKNLLSWWQSGIIADKDLKKRGPKDHIIYNSNLYDKLNSKYIVQAYEWLSDERNVKAYMDVTNENDGTLKNFFVLVQKGALNGNAGKFTSNVTKFKDIKDFRNWVIFVDQYNVEGKINDATDIQRRLAKMQDAKKPVENDDDDYVTPVKGVKPEAYRTDEINDILSGGISKLNRKQVNKLLNYLKDKGWI